VLNKTVVEKGVLLAKAMHSDIRMRSFFDRKNYFYPDLPKGYQISQYDLSLASGGYLEIPMPEGYTRRVSIHKLHMEEDAGKTKNAGNLRLIDFNRCGVPLVEMVTGPDLRSANEAAQYLIRLRQLLRWLGISEADMEKGHLRCDANVSIRPKGSDQLFTKTEIKNVNSIDNVKNAIEHEVERQIREVEAGKRVHAWTLDWDDEKNELRKMRSKETEADYRYFREPDLLPLDLTQAWLDEILADFPELPLERKARFISEYKLPEYDADILTGERNLSDYFESAVKMYAGDPKKVSNYLMNDVLRMLNESGKTANQLKLTPAYLAEILKMVDAGQINTSTGKSLLEKVENSGKSPKSIVETEGLGLVSDDSAIRAVAEKIVAANPKEVEAFRAGKETLIGWFTGQVMREMRGKADPKMATQILLELLKK
jgi:aspartyl-tRNA(Asn)/glutamyl-tRNA(Gln) amidotransferase subunit B